MSRPRRTGPEGKTRAERKKRCEKLVALFSRAPIKKTTGMSLCFNEKNEAVFDLPHNPGFEHGLGDTHGGIIATLLDNAGWFAVAVEYDSWIATVEIQVRLLEPARREPLRAVGRILRAGQSLAVAEMEVRTLSGRLVATGSGTFAVTSLVLEKEHIK
jgi:uncharacterized protein (TIGR00369 family)